MNDSPLGKLPAELRNQVYELALTRDTPICIKHVSNGANSTESAEPRNPAALTQTCREICQECSSMFYALNTFAFALKSDVANSDGSYNTNACQRFLESNTKDKMSQLQNVILTHSSRPECDTDSEGPSIPALLNTLGLAAASAVRLWKEAPTCGVKLQLNTLGYLPGIWDTLKLNMDDLNTSMQDLYKELKVVSKQNEGTEIGLKFKITSLAVQSPWQDIRFREQDIRIRELKTMIEAREKRLHLKASFDAAFEKVFEKK